MTKPVCVKCECFMRPKKNGFYSTEGKPHGGTVPWDGNRGKGSEGWTPYKIWAGDLWECPCCLYQIITTGTREVSIQHDIDFDHMIEVTKADQLLVKDC